MVNSASLTDLVVNLASSEDFVVSLANLVDLMVKCENLSGLVNSFSGFGWHIQCCCCCCAELASFGKLGDSNGLSATALI